MEERESENKRELERCEGCGESGISDMIEVKSSKRGLGMNSMFGAGWSLVNKVRPKVGVGGLLARR